MQEFTRHIAILGTRINKVLPIRLPSVVIDVLNLLIGDIEYRNVLLKPVAVFDTGEQLGMIEKIGGSHPCCQRQQSDACGGEPSHACR